jgi:putative peptide maturation dehydrogenase
MEFDLGLLATGGTGLRSVSEWVAMAPHAGQEIGVTIDEMRVFGEILSSDWLDFGELTSVYAPDLIEALLSKKLLVAEGTDLDERERILRDTHWRSASAAMHYASRWRGVDTEAMERQFAEVTNQSLLDVLGPPPPLVRERTDAELRFRLQMPKRSPLDELLGRRVTCRNFDPQRLLAQDVFAGVLYRVYGARAVDDFAPGVQLLKKSVPSAGGLHPTEAYLLIQRVEGIAPGLYHYHPVDHALEPIRLLEVEEAALLARQFVASQAYFTGAHVLVIPVSRFRRNFWKYRNHAKAYRTLLLDVGHLSQTLYLAATETGLGAFITAAVNEVDIEQAFGLDPLEEGAVAVCGFGVRAAQRLEVEFDPLRAVWKAD